MSSSVYNMLEQCLSNIFSEGFFLHDWHGNV